MVTFSFIAQRQMLARAREPFGRPLGLPDCPCGTGSTGVVCHSRSDIRRTARSWRLSGFRTAIVEPPVAPADLAGVHGRDAMRRGRSWRLDQPPLDRRGSGTQAAYSELSLMR